MVWFIRPWSGNEMSSFVEGCEKSNFQFILLLLSAHFYFFYLLLWKTKHQLNSFIPESQYRHVTPFAQITQFLQQDLKLCTCHFCLFITWTFVPWNVNFLPKALHETLSWDEMKRDKSHNTLPKNVVKYPKIPGQSAKPC